MSLFSYIVFSEAEQPDHLLVTGKLGDISSTKTVIEQNPKNVGFVKAMAKYAICLELWESLDYLGLGHLPIAMHKFWPETQILLDTPQP